MAISNCLFSPTSESSRGFLVLGMVPKSITKHVALHSPELDL
jgi:hypothetical protein